MAFLKSHRGAVLLSVLLVILSILFGFRRSVTAARAQVEALFYDGGSGYSIQAGLDERCAVARNLLTVASRYLSGEDTADVSAAVRMLEQADDPAEKYEWNQALGWAAEELLATLEDCDLTERDAAYVQGFRADLTGLANTIRRDSYNQQAGQFNREVLGAFPANLLKHITFVREVPLFR